MRRLRRAFACVLLPIVLAPLAAAAQEVQRQRAPVVIANRTIIELRGPIAGYSAEERAKASTARIEAALEAEPKGEVSFGDHEGGTRVRVAGRHAFLVTKIDIDEAAGETQQLVAAEAAKRLRAAIAG